jgi:methylenetetrahydrofolate reductase (NADPH)
MAAACGASIPDSIRTRLDGRDDEDAALIATDIAAEQCQALIKFGVRHFHFYTLNRADMVRDICAQIGVSAGASATR